MSLKNNKYSDLKIFGFPEKIRSFQHDRITAPIYVRIKPTNRCNHGCKWCAYSDGTLRPKDTGHGDHLQTGMHGTMREHDQMPLDKAFELLDDLAEMGTKAVTFSGGGEPLIHPHIGEIMIRTLRNHLDLSIITNGQALSQANASLLGNAKWVRVSVDYANAEQMAKSRNVPERMFQQVMDNLLHFAKTKDVNCDLGINFIVTRENHMSLVKAARVLKSVGVENIRFSPVYCEGFLAYHQPLKDAVLAQLHEIQSFCDAKFSVNSFYDIDSDSKKPVRPFTRCRYQEVVPVVGADLGVYRCHNTAYSEHGLIGSIDGQRFKHLWFSEEAQANMRKFDPSAHCHHECANSSKVALFNRLAESSSDNFV